MKKRLLTLVLAASMMTLGLTACGGSNSSEGEKKESKDEGGTLTLAGSTSMEKLCEALSESFMEKHPEVEVTVEYTGTGAGLESLAAGSVDIGRY